MAKSYSNRLGCYGKMLAFLTILLPAAVAVAEPHSNTFPGASRSVSSPDGSGARIFYRPQLDRYGGQAHPVFYADGRGHRIRVATVTRSMDVTWSSDGRRVFLQDSWGSNAADCYVLIRIAKSVSGVSLLKIVQRTRGHPIGNEKPSASHYYVHCDRWLSSTRIEGGVSGHTDSNPAHDFDHRFVYDVATKQIRWQA